MHLVIGIADNHPSFCDFRVQTNHQFVLIPIRDGEQRGPLFQQGGVGLHGRVVVTDFCGTALFSCCQPHENFSLVDLKSLI